MRYVVGPGALWLALGVSACLEEQRYDVIDEPVQLTADAQPTFVTDDDKQIFRVDRLFSLLLTPPTQGDLDRLTAEAAGRMLPFPRLPWVNLHDLDLQLDYALTNQGGAPIVALITVNGVNEFFYYAPRPEDLHQWEWRVSLAPGQRVSGTVTEPELDEVAIDLATVVNGAPNSNLVVDAHSQSGRDPRVKPYIPSVIPGLVGVRAGLETARAEDLLLEVTIRVQDHGDRASKRGEKHWDIPPAQPFTPVVPEQD